MFAFIPNIEREEDVLKVELNKGEIYGLLKALSPPYDWIKEYTQRGYGYFVGGFNNEWHWDISREKLEGMSEEELYQEYLTLKAYWNNQRWR